MINYYCPDFYKGKLCYLILSDLKEKYPEMFYEDVNIKKVFGNFPSCIWNGGGTQFGKPSDITEIIEVFNFYKDIKIQLQLTFTNPLLEENDVFDRYGNIILAIINEDFLDNCEVLVSSKILEDYIRIKYPKIRISKSIIASKEDIDYKKELEKYENVVLPIRIRENLDSLKGYSKEELARLEFLANDPCPVDCPRLYTHYNAFADVTLFKNTSNSSINPIIKCQNSKLNDLVCFNENHYITYEKIKKDYVPIGLTEFKISGRGGMVKIVCNVIPYLIKPEYQVGIIKNILGNFFNE